MTVRNKDLVVAGVTEWATDYRCKKCGNIITVADDSDHALHPEEYHTDCPKDTEYPA